MFEKLTVPVTPVSLRTARPVPVFWYRSNGAKLRAFRSSLEAHNRRALLNRFRDSLAQLDELEREARERLAEAGSTDEDPATVQASFDEAMKSIAQSRARAEENLDASDSEPFEDDASEAVALGQLLASVVVDVELRDSATGRSQTHAFPSAESPGDLREFVLDDLGLAQSYVLAESINRGEFNRSELGKS